MTDRERFEAWISAPPYERSVSRHPPDGSVTAWPGQYRDYFAQLAWEAWQAAKCPFVVTTDEGTSYCELAAGNARDFDALVGALEDCRVSLNAVAGYSAQPLMAKDAQRRVSQIDDALSRIRGNAP